MITIKDWIAIIPEEDRHLAYMGEHMTVNRQFLLTGDGWEEWKDWGFHLDMAFDLSSVTTKDTRQLESTQVESSETVSDTLIKTSATTQHQKYTVSDVSVDCHSETDIAVLKKEFTDEGILLTWRVLRQHTQLPGRLWATIRALGHNGEIKKTAVMVFDVGVAVQASPAADLPESELETMEEYIDTIYTEMLKNSQMVQLHKESAETFAEEAKAAARKAENIELKVSNEVDGLALDMQDITDEVDKMDTDILALQESVAVQETALFGQKLELEDLREAYNGSRYDTAGDAVRSQIGANTYDIQRLTDRVSQVETTVNNTVVDSALNYYSPNAVANSAVTPVLVEVNGRTGQLVADVNQLKEYLPMLNSVQSVVSGISDRLSALENRVNEHLGNA